MKYLLITSFFSFLIINSCYSQKMFIDGNNAWNLDQSVVKSDNGDVLYYFTFNLFDDNSNTAIALNSNVMVNKDGNSYFRILLLKSIIVDRIVILNGYCKSINTYSNNNRVKELKFEFSSVERIIVSNGVYNETIINDKGQAEKIKFEYKKVYDTNIILNDNGVFQDVSIGKLSNFNSIDVTIMDTYPGIKYDDTCISEIEFWYQGKKYEVANLEQAKKDFLARYKKELLNWLPVNLPHYIKYSETNRFKKTIENKGLKEEVKAIEFDKNGGIFIYPESVKMVVVRKDGTYELNRKARIKLGDWKIGVNAEIMVKLNGGSWETTGDYKFFRGTFLEMDYHNEEGLSYELEAPQ